ncbi:hydrolase [Oceanobacillus bengalensis]|uniref:Hydrolase n=1 Tax=Oceanobacillus bengalensis TaxID=1435466 RepID=A0A494YWC8_9BACI|nr:hydrolase [Oceanobacillus bengalensis]RKQ14511.1 hydrolase [Oceanobacillus bengalensis]
MEKSRYYINIGTGEISQEKYDNNDDFVVHATETEIGELRRIINHMQSADIGTFFRAHVPIVEYHNDSSNDAYDENLIVAFQMIHDLGDEKTQKHIESMGILGNNSM